MDPSRLVVDMIYVNRGHYLRRIKFHGKGRFGIMYKYRAHLSVYLREVPPVAGEVRLGISGPAHSSLHRTLTQLNAAGVAPRYISVSHDKNFPYGLPPAAKTKPALLAFNSPAVLAGAAPPPPEQMQQKMLE